MAAPAAASIAIPSDVHAFAANVSPRGVDLEGRLDLSLDALIKERKKEHKLLKKQEETKKQKKQKRKTPKQQSPKKQPIVKNGQRAQRKALVSKNRGLPTQPPAKEKAKTKTSIAATTAKLRRQMRADKAKSLSGRQVVSPRAGNQSNTSQQKKKKNTLQQARRVTPPTQPTTQSNTFVRQVVRASNKWAKLSITITGKAGKKSEKKQKANKVVLPGKLSQALAKKESAAKSIVKRAKNRKTSAANTPQVVRKVPGQRKKN